MNKTNTSFKPSRNRSHLSFKGLNFDSWSLLWSRVLKTNLLQSWQYGNAKKQADQIKVYRYVFKDNLDKPIALVQVLIKDFNLLGYYFGSIVRINRGPLLLDKDIHSIDYLETYLLVLKNFFTQAKSRKWWIVLIAPEVLNTSFNKKSLRKTGLFFRKKIPWGSSLVYLNRNDDDILNGFKPRWRRCYRKSLRYGIHVDKYPNDQITIDQVIYYYNLLQKEKEFIGLSESLIRELIFQNGNGWSVNTYISRSSNDNLNEHILGILLTITHGDTCIYLLGYTNSKGRLINANYLMFWEAILDSKKQGCTWFDLGGITSDTTTGIKQFKQGFNGEKYDLLGEGVAFTFFV